MRESGESRCTRGYLHGVAGEAARVRGFSEALLAGRQEAGRDGVADNLSREHKALRLILRQWLHVAYHPSILPLAACANGQAFPQDSLLSIVVTGSANPKPGAMGHTCRASAGTSVGPTIVCSYHSYHSMHSLHRVRMLR